MRLDSTPATQGTGGASTLGEATARALAGEGVQVPIFEFDAEVLAAPAAEIGCVFSAAELTDDNVVDAGFAGGREARYLCLLEKTIAINLVGTLRCIAKSSAGEVTLDPLDARGSATRSPTLQQWRRRTGRSARHPLQLRKPEYWL
jgi:NAD(P)-dependent dehydrogenase (short-subunit alcohol dehydrogenase family)